MAIAFEGVFLSREMSARCPAIDFNSVSLANVAPDHLKMDKGSKDLETNLEIIANNSNLGVDSTTGWHQNTELNCDFNNSLEGGTLRDFDSEINGVVVRRTSVRSNFKDWEDVVVFPIAPGSYGNMDIEYDDIFVESGVLYKYALQPTSGSNRGPMTAAKPAILDYQYSWFIGEDEKQLMVAYDTQITSYSKVVRDSLIETIGGKYPYVLRNANVDYATFQMSATITQFMDIEETFFTNSNMFLVPGVEENKDLNVTGEYNEFFSTHGMDKKENYVYEREFRTKLMEFLYDGKPKVFKSDTEGLLLVKLSNIGLTPKNELGRTIYNFSCSVTEIGKIDFSSLIDYKIKKGVKLSELK